MTVERRTFYEERMMFSGRVECIRPLLVHRGLWPVLEAALSYAPTVLDLFTGTGAGMQSAYDVLATDGKPPREMVAVDDFKFLPTDQPVTKDWILFANETASVLNQQETERNLEWLATQTKVQVVRANAWDYLRTPEAQRMFGLTTGFSVPLTSEDFSKLMAALAARRYYDGAQMPVLLTVSALHSRIIPEHRRVIKKLGLEGEWNFYQKPDRLPHPLWDCTILSNRSLGLARLPE